MYVCGAGLFKFWHHFKKAFITQPTLVCADSIEPYFYTLDVCARRGLTEQLNFFARCERLMTVDITKIIKIMLTVV